jgi:hypothetical protein
MDKESKEELKEIISIAKNLMNKEIYNIDTCKITSALYELRGISIKRPSTEEIFSKCPFWSGVEYQGMYECMRDKSICYGCDYNSRYWYRRLWFKITTEIEMWYHCSFTFQISKLKAYLFNRQDYERYFVPYWWDRRKRK